MRNQSLEATCHVELPCEISDPADQVLWQKDEEQVPKSEADFEMGGFKKTLVIEPTHPSNSGAYYCATVEDVAQLFLQNQGDFFQMFVFL